MTSEQDAVEPVADLVRHLYRAFLGREPSPGEVVEHGDRLKHDGTNGLSCIVYSAEAVAVRTEAEAARVIASNEPEFVLPPGTLPIQRTDVADVVVATLSASRPEAPSPYEVALRVDAFSQGTNLSTVLSDAFDATPQPPSSIEDEASINQTIQIMYRLALGRVPGDIDLETWRAVVTNGGRLSDVVFGIGESPESKMSRWKLDVVPGTKVQLAFEIVLGRGASAAEVDHFRTITGKPGSDISPLVWQLFADEARRRLLPPEQANDPHQAYLFGSRGVLTIANWNAASTTTERTRAKHAVLGRNSVVRLLPLPADNARECVVSIITSLYRGGAFIRSFLENMTTQTIFRTHCELIIIDANSPEGEHVIIEEFCRDFPNIIYKRMDARVGIYEAWNIGIEIANGRYITNANVDDLRQNDSFEIQAAVLDSLPFVDVTYQDVVYSFEPRLPFENIARRNFTSDLPVVSRYNLMEFNSPHNAPMWRAALHRDVGLFNQTLQSAADFEFWLRCRIANKVFYKVNEAHVAYFVNPTGMSTRPDTRGAIEANAVSRDLYRTIVSPLLVIADDAFIARVEEVVEVPLRTGNRYDIVQSALLSLGTKREGLTTHRKREELAPDGDGAEPLPDAGREGAAA